jgi:putative transposase
MGNEQYPLHGFTLLAPETDEDHVPCFVSAPPKDSPAKMVGLLRRHSARRIRAPFPPLAKKTGKAQLWTSAYYVGTAGQVSAEVMRRYIMECQGKQPLALINEIRRLSSRG